ncbi:major facilitator superfamily domain-containing protein 1-like [Mercenaria mercenaria]|uniref:major facilitator superfamily domain-containing protein 1-like n=1 Tax=Mercenaria mercenaria TaxID=6596 RepID=UPI00234EF474|nr:major facilitator superfamily domain-containing protein 1-like [Mercenaria mercenaria]
MDDEADTQALLNETESSSSTSENVSTKQCSPCDPRTALHRYIFLVFICITGVGDYFCVDTPAALQNHFLKDLNISETKFMTFYSNIQWASIVSCIFGVFLIDKIYGNRLGMSL